VFWFSGTFISGILVLWLLLIYQAIPGPLFLVFWFSGFSWFIGFSRDLSSWYSGSLPSPGLSGHPGTFIPGILVLYLLQVYQVFQGPLFLVFWFSGFSRFIRFSRFLYSWYSGSLASPGLLRFLRTFLPGILVLYLFQVYQAIQGPLFLVYWFSTFSRFIRFSRDLSSRYYGSLASPGLSGYPGTFLPSILVLYLFQVYQAIQGPLFLVYWFSTFSRFIRFFRDLSSWHSGSLPSPGLSGFPGTFLPGILFL